MKHKVNGKFHQYDEESLKKAVEAVRNGGKLRETCRQYGVPKSTVQDRIKGKVSDVCKQMGPDPVLTRENEQEIVNWIENLAKCGFPIKKHELLDTVQKIVQEEKLETPFTNGRPGQSWFSGFMKRHPLLALKNAESLKKYRAQITEEYIRSWFEDLKSFLIESNAGDILEDPSRILNGDESGFCLCPKTGKVLGVRGRDLNIVKKGNGKENLTVLITFTADGRLCPPLVVFPYVKPPKNVTDRMPPHWVLGKSDSGWMRSDVFYEFVVNDLNEWLNEEKIQKPVLFLVDGHKSHMSVELSRFCDENSIILYALPPNATHLLQPADVSVFKPLKDYWREEVRKWQSENENRVVTKVEFCSIFQKALQNPKMSNNMQNGFKACGLYPFNPDAVNYKKCVQNVLEKLSNRTEENVKDKIEDEILHADILSTEKVILKLRPKFSERGFCTDTILTLVRSLIPATSDGSGVSFFTPEEMEGMEVVFAEDAYRAESEVSEVSDQNPGVVIIQNILLNSPQSKQNSENLNQRKENLIMKENSEISNEELDQNLKCSEEDVIMEQETFVRKEDDDKLQNIITETNLSPEKIEDTKTSKDVDEIEKPIIYEQRLETENTFQEVPDVKKSNLKPEQVTTARESTNAIIDRKNLDEQKIVKEKQVTEESTPMRKEIITTDVCQTQPVTDETNFEKEQPGRDHKLTEKNEKDVTKPPITEKRLQVETSQGKTMEESTSLGDNNDISNPFDRFRTQSMIKQTSSSFEKHLSYPQPLNKNAKKRQREKIPSAISAGAWRKYYEDKIREKEEKENAKRKRKVENEKKKQSKKTKSRILENKYADPENQKARGSSIRDNETDMEICGQENPDQSKCQHCKQKCQECEEELESDTEIESEKNLGCDLCPRWYHLGCTKLSGHSYVEVSSLDFICKFCDD